jgi:hypothetical protein
MKKGKETVEVVYLITSDSGADPATLAAWIRGWRAETTGCAIRGRLSCWHRVGRCTWCRKS